jgi:hypothetical protein
MSIAAAPPRVFDESRCRAEIHVEPYIEDGRIIYRRQCRNAPEVNKRLSDYCRAHRFLDDSGCPICEGGFGSACGWHSYE